MEVPQEVIDAIVGRMVQEVSDEAHCMGAVIRVVREDGNGRFFTSEHCPNRINVSVASGVIIEVVSIG